MPPTLHRLYLSLGSNLGDREATLQRALRLISERVGRVERVSSFIETEPQGFLSCHKFINACCLALTSLTPRQCLLETQAIERMLGRREKTEGCRYRDRAIDIDLLLYDDLRVLEPGLTLPHPRMQEREFVMKPLAEIGA
ncbi:MAG: 2-amino-4-hydroxy-6-hydroxymethyldihydropteridine diphosphokinase [Prevotellaceae bacterium]|nr:2-amino-4-hydroxy-6-hydroxymethyldihydropteridine diphosphokinase [Prevotellaceae bacterium]